jgi:hypothetical protein
MKKPLRRSLSVLAALALTASGVALTATSASALPATATISEQNCDIPTGGTLFPFVDGAEITIVNSDQIDEDLDYSIVLDFQYDSPYEQGTVAAGDDRTLVIPLEEDSSTTIQVLDTSEGGGIIGGGVVDVNCTPDYSPEAVGSIQPASCAFPTGGIIPPSPGFSFTLDNSEGTGPAAYAFVAGDVEVESGTIDAGETRVRAWSLEEDTPLTATVSSVDADGEPVVLAESIEEVNCLADTPVLVTPVDGSEVASPVDITGTGTAGDLITVVVGDESVLGDRAGLLAAAEPTVPVEEGDGLTIYEVTVGADGSFAVLADLAEGEYGAVAIASREASDDGLVPASVSDPSNVVLFTVAAVIPPTPTPTPTPDPTPVPSPTPTTPAVPSVPSGNGGSGTTGGSLARTGAAPFAAAGAGLLLLVAGGASVLVLRRRRTA